mmetsp:Transcript_9344/g.26275  ORF Transcript_9344/g.26275 Transcript_9344/m.26275 type:complete len:207 (-) Transcript_9344:484-1104(-)
MIVRIRDPNGRGFVIGRANADALPPRPGPEVVPERVVVLPPVFQDVAVPVRVEGNVVLDQDVVRAVDDDAALLALPDDVLADDAASDAAGHVEVDGIPPKNALLAKVANLHPLEVLGDVGRVEDDEMTAVEGVVGAVGRSVAVGLEDDGTAEPRHLGRRAKVVVQAGRGRTIVVAAKAVGLREADPAGGGIDGPDRLDDLIRPPAR